MIIGKTLPFVSAFIESLDEAIKENMPNSGLSRIQKGWLSFCIMAILVTNSVCWAKFERAGFGKYSLAALSWMFRQSKIPWEILLYKSVRVILRRFGITEGSLVIDDSEKKRSKKTAKIDFVHKLKDKDGGFIMGQCIVFLILVSPLITVPVGFAFYMPDPAMTAWNKLKKQGVPSKKRPPRPPKNEKYPAKAEIALSLLEQFVKYHPGIRIRCILADALYGNAGFVDKASEICGGVQVISKIKKDQNIRFRNKKQSVEKYFKKHPGVSYKIKIRGGKEITVIVNSARLYL